MQIISEELLTQVAGGVTGDDGGCIPDPTNPKGLGNTNTNEAGTSTQAVN